MEKCILVSFFNPKKKKTKKRTENQKHQLEKDNEDSSDYVDEIQEGNKNRGKKEDHKGKRGQVSYPGHYIRKEVCLQTAGVMLY